MKVLVTTIVSLNPGDAAILQGTIRVLQRAFGDDVDVTVIDRDGDAAAKYYPWATFRTSLFSDRRRGPLLEWARKLGYVHRIRRLDSVRYRIGGRLLSGPLRPLASVLLSREERRTLQHYVDADLVIASGGTYLVEYYNLLPPLLDYELVLALGKRLVFFPQSLGPFHRTGYRTRLQRVFHEAHALFLRDTRSADHLVDLGVPRERITVTGDAAFALAYESFPPEPRHPADGPLRVAVSVREWRHFDGSSQENGQARYEATVAAGITALIRDRAARVTFLSTCQGVAEFWADDAAVAQRILERLPPDVRAGCQIDDRFRQPGALVEEFSGFDAVIATRMHAAILALCGGVPALAIAYEFKTVELYAALGQSGWVVDINRLDPREFVALVNRFVDGLPGLRHAFQEAVRRRREVVLEISDALRRQEAG